jgi:hypothetical protein
MYHMQLQELEPRPGSIIKSPTGSLHIIVGDVEGEAKYKTVRISPDKEIREGQVFREHPITPESGVVVYRTDSSRREPFLAALKDPAALSMLSGLLKNLDVLVPVSATLGRERGPYKAYLSNVHKLESFAVHQERVSDRGPLIEVGTMYGGRGSATIDFVFATDDHVSQIPAYIRHVSADPEIRSVDNYKKVMTSVVNAAGLFNMVVPALDAGSPRITR